MSIINIEFVPLIRFKASHSPSMLTVHAPDGWEAQISKRCSSMIRKGTRVCWRWGKGTAEGNVISTHAKKITKTIKGTQISRDGVHGNKALYIKQDDGAFVLKSESEVKRVKD